MANWSDLKASVAKVIKTNGNQEITGQVLQNVLNSIISNVGQNATFIGVAIPTTNPGVPDGPVFYLASQVGTYSNFNNIEVKNQVVVIENNNGNWVKKETGIPTNEIFTEIGVNLGLTSSFTANRMILGIETNFYFDSADLYFANRNIGVEYASQLIIIRFTIDGEVKSFDYRKYNGVLSVNKEIITLNNSELKVNINVDWGGIAIDERDIVVNKYEVLIYPKEIKEYGEDIKKLQNEKLDKSELINNYSILENTNSVRGCQIEEDSITLGGETNWNLCVFNKIINIVVFKNSSGTPYLVFGENKVCYYVFDFLSQLKGRIFGLYKKDLSKINKIDITIGGFNEVPIGTQKYTIKTIKTINKNIIEIYYELIQTGEKGLLVSIDISEISDLFSIDTYFVLGIATLMTNGTFTEIELMQNIATNNKETIEDFTRLSNNDIDNVSEGSYIVAGNSIKNLSALSRTDFLLLSEDIKAIEFKISSLWDINAFIALCLGYGKENETKCFASMQLPTQVRNDVKGIIKNSGATDPQVSSAVGEGRFSPPYRHPQNYFYNVSVGDKCMIEIINEQYICGYVWKENKWERWFIIDTKGYWLNNQNDGTLRYGWNERIGIGICGYYGTANANTTFLTDIKVVSRKGTQLYDIHEANMGRNKPKRKWVAIGDSITAIDRNNGLSYVGFANRLLNYEVINKGKSGWLIVEMWKKRLDVGWETDIENLSDYDVVSILMGTNDWHFNQNGKPYTLGDTNPNSEDAKDENTTLGALRLIIEKILELKPTAKLILFTPFYRTKGEGPIVDGKFPVVTINQEGKTIYEYAEAIYNVGKEYNIPAYNLAKDSGINSITLEAYTYDNLHINENGGYLIGTWMQKKI